VKDPASAPPRGRLFWPLAGAGWVVMGVGVAGILRHAGRTQPPELVRWLAGSALVHDLLLAPAVCVIGLVVARLVPSPARRFLQAGLVVSGMLALAVFPLVGGFGKDPRDPSALPGNYGLGLLVVLGSVWLVVAVLAVRAVARAHRGPPG
jgi:hypothetical protein